MSHFLTALRWQDIIDILIVSFLFYRTIMLIMGTRAMQMSIGILVITVIYVAARELDLLALQHLLGTLLSSSLLLIFIIFQHDIRRALMQVGQSPFSKTPDIALQDLSEIIKAVHYLAKRRVGAIIVIEKESGLRDYIETGHLLDARLSRELLISIFLPSSLMHDGGVVIRKDRVHSAGCLLPLSQNPNISKRYGTRHRAAIGLSEETDALIIVVSEETQEISLVKQGHIEIIRDDEHLTHRLRSSAHSQSTFPATWLNRFTRSKSL